MLPSYVLLDLETTGIDPVHDRITEIAAIRVDDGAVTRRWESLVNPGQPISPFIQKLTGITNAMAGKAPDFQRVLPDLLALLDGAVLVAHNVRFDHGFLKHAIARTGATLCVDTLCTVRLSRRLYPRATGHGLDAIMRRHGLSTTARHRAMGDVELLHAWLRVARDDLGAQTLQTAAQALLRSTSREP